MVEGMGITTAEVISAHEKRIEGSNPAEQIWLKEKSYCSQWWSNEMCTSSN